ncbi:DUF4870 family protein [Rhizobium sp. PAMB 3182]
MSENGQAFPDSKGLLEPGKANVQLVYVLYLFGFIVGITPLIGVVIAYLNRGKAGGWVESHYNWQIRTFWIGLLFSLVSLVLTFVFIGILLFVLTAVWMIARCVVGLQKAGNEEPIANPQSWIL